VSKGVDDLDNPVGHRLSTSQALYSAGKGRILRLPVSNLGIEVIDIVEQWERSLHKYGLEISTGPVVPFRAEDLISGTKHWSKEFVPLIWMQHVHSMKVEWPCLSMKTGKEKPQFIKANKEAFRRRLILEDQNLVLLMIFSAKEQQRRLTAASLAKGQIGSDLIGLENRVNYIYRPKDKLSKNWHWVCQRF
jgi:adenine-specific DNA-methyltransferase